MTRALFAAVALAALPLGSRAGEPAVRLTVSPMAAPKPALKYQLLPEVRELNPGNPAQWYVRCFQEQRNFFFGKESVAQRARYRSMPLAELPAGQLRNYGGGALKQADWAARMDALDWQMVQRVQTEGTDQLLPELVPLRVLATALQVRFRGEVAGRHFDDAVRTAKTMFALARHLGDYPAEAANRVGLFTADLGLDTLEEMLQQPGCPNLYWALTDLPCPLVDLRKGLQGDRTLAEADMRPIRDDVAMTEAQVEAVVSRLSGAVGFAREQAGRAPRNLRGELDARLKDADRVAAVRRRLLGEGHSVLRVWQMPATQVVLLDEKRAYETQRDEDMKLLALAPWQIDALRVPGLVPEEQQTLFADLLPHVLPARRAQARLEQRIALLRHVEALRLYAAVHDGRLPETLSEVAVPLPPDPFTGKPFAYAIAGATAHLRGAPPQAGEPTRDVKSIYELTIRK